MYQLKNKSLEGRVKGHLILTLDVDYNPIRAAVRTVNPRDPKIMFDPPKFKRAVRNCVLSLFESSSPRNFNSVVKKRIEFHCLPCGFLFFSLFDEHLCFMCSCFQLLQRNIDRVNKLVASLVSTGAFVQSLFTWQYKFRSAFAFAVSILV